MSPVQLSYMINQNVVIDSISIDHNMVKKTWNNLFHDPYVRCLIIPSDAMFNTSLLLQEPGKAPPKKVEYSPLSFVPHCGSDPPPPC